MLTLFFIVFIVFTNSSFPQQSKLSKSVNKISEYIASSEFLILKEKVGELSTVDSIYSKALKLNDNDHSEALLSLAFATVPYREVPIQIPVIKVVLYYPLISASDSIFNLKNE